MVTELAEDLETHVRPLPDSFSDEMNDLLVSQEIQDEESIRDVATEAVGEVVSESLEEAINDYFAAGGKDLIDSAVREAVDKILGQRIQEGIRQSLRAQRFTGTFIVDAEDKWYQV
ncbi:hypothetical protein KJ359_001719 [Pestalotiopsis sp. 9143b]|nr:hypothetical protein KJ359_001719 [Pestalotiopsis sp. 9143b]